MPNNVAHFSINADDVERARAFYEGVFGWRFTPYGPPGFYRIQTGDDDDPGLRGALQQRRELVSGLPTIGFECTVAVDDVDATAAAVVARGGRVIMAKRVLPGVGELIFVRDPAGNVLGAMRYDDSVT